MSYRPEDRRPENASGHSYEVGGTDNYSHHNQSDLNGENFNSSLEATAFQPSYVTSSAPPKYDDPYSGSNHSTYFPRNDHEYPTPYSQPFEEPNESAFVEPYPTASTSASVSVSVHPTQTVFVEPYPNDRHSIEMGSSHAQANFIEAPADPVATPTDTYSALLAEVGIHGDSVRDAPLSIEKDTLQCRDFCESNVAIILLNFLGWFGIGMIGMVFSFSTFFVPMLFPTILLLIPYYVVAVMMAGCLWCCQGQTSDTCTYQGGRVIAPGEIIHPALRGEVITENQLQEQISGYASSVPQIYHEVVCYHMTGGKNRRRVITYQAQYPLQVTSFIDTTAHFDDSMKILRSQTYRPIIRLKSVANYFDEQKDMLEQIKTELYEHFRHVDTRCVVNIGHGQPERTLDNSHMAILQMKYEQPPNALRQCWESLFYNTFMLWIASYLVCLAPYMICWRCSRHKIQYTISKKPYLSNKYFPPTVLRSSRPVTPFRPYDETTPLVAG